MSDRLKAIKYFLEFQDLDLKNIIKMHHNLNLLGVSYEEILEACEYGKVLEKKKSAWIELKKRVCMGEKIEEYKTPLEILQGWAKDDKEFFKRLDESGVEKTEPDLKYPRGMASGSAWTSPWSKDHYDK